MNGFAPSGEPCGDASTRAAAPAAAGHMGRGNPTCCPKRLSYETETLPAIATALAISAPATIITPGHRLCLVDGERTAVELRAIQ